MEMREAMSTICGFDGFVLVEGAVLVAVLVRDV
jgi:hypothetical protein